MFESMFNNDKNSKIINKKMEELFSEFDIPDPYSFEMYDAFSGVNHNNSVIHDTKIIKEYFTTPDQTNDKVYVLKIAKKNPEILAFVDEELKNDEELFLKLCKNKISCAQYIGKDLRNNNKFLLKLNDLNPNCWKYIVKKHYYPSTLEQKICFWWMFWLGILENKKISPQINVKEESEKVLSYSLMGAFTVWEKISPTSDKKDIIKFLEDYFCYTLIPYYNFNVNTTEITKKIVQINYKDFEGVSNWKEAFKKYDIVYTFWECSNFRNTWYYFIYEGIKNFPNDINLAELILLKIKHFYALEYFSEKIRGNKELILRLLNLIKNRCYGYLLAYLTDDLKQDTDIINAVKRNPDVYEYWQKAEKKLKKQID